MTTETTKTETPECDHSAPALNWPKCQRCAWKEIAARGEEASTERALLKERIAALEAFKAYVHQRLDAAGIEKEPNGPHSREGCRVGDRLDLLIGQRDEARQRIATLEAQLAEKERQLGEWVKDVQHATAVVSDLRARLAETEKALAEAKERVRRAQDGAAREVAAVEKERDEAMETVRGNREEADRRHEEARQAIARAEQRADAAEAMLDRERLAIIEMRRLYDAAEARAKALEDVLAARLIDDGMSALSARSHVAAVQRAALAAPETTMPKHTCPHGVLPMDVCLSCASEPKPTPRFFYEAEDIEQARAEERERCAVTADRHAHVYREQPDAQAAAENIATDIRGQAWLSLAPDPKPAADAKVEAERENAHGAGRCICDPSLCRSWEHDKECPEYAPKPDAGEARGEVERIRGFWQEAISIGNDARAEVRRLKAELAEAKKDLRMRTFDYEGACKTIAAMLEPIRGKGNGPNRGVVEDVMDVVAEHDRLRAALEEARGVLERIAAYGGAPGVVGSDIARAYFNALAAQGVKP